jgi:hypothetical protein
LSLTSSSNDAVGLRNLGLKRLHTGDRVWRLHRRHSLWHVGVIARLLEGNTLSTHMASTLIREDIETRKADPAKAIIDAFDRPLLLLPQVRRPETELAAAHKPEPLEGYAGAVRELNLHRSRRLLNLHHWDDVRLVLTLSQRQILRSSGAVVVVRSDHRVEVDIEGEIPTRRYVPIICGTQVPPI